MMYQSLNLQSVLQQKLSEHFSHITNLQLQSIGGGCINETYRLTFSNQMLFCKINSASKFPHLFHKEKNGLNLIAQQKQIKVPSVIDCFEHEDKQILLLEWITEGERTETFWKSFGEQLAMLHQCSNELFGLHEGNYMGSVPQQNHQQKNWINFFVDERLNPMIERCLRKNLLTEKHSRQFENLIKKLPNIFSEEEPSLQHGDLWSGNFMCNQNSEPVLIDPAVYYGHRSMDLGMTTLFGGFRRPFYESYHYHFPFPKNYEEQWQVCNLYPLLIHLYLFGSSYLAQIEIILKSYV